MVKKILVVSQRYWPEDTKITDICEGIAEKGLKVDVLCGQPNYPQGQFYEGYHSWGHKIEKHNNVRLYRTMEIRKDTGSPFRILMNYLMFPLAGRFKIPALKSARYNAVLVYQRSPVFSDTVGLKIGRKLGIPVTTYAIDIWPQHFYQELDIQNTILKKLFDWIARRHYLAADRIIVQSRKAADFFIQTLHMHPGKVNCIPPAADEYTEEETYDLAVMEKYAGSFNIVIFDEQLRSQDYDTLFKACQSLLNAGISDIRFIIIGNGRKLPQLKKKTDKLNLNDMVFFEGKKPGENHVKYYQIANAFLSCMLVDAADDLAFPEEMARFMAFEKPILASCGIQEKEIIRQAGCGLVCDPADPEGLFGMIMSLYRSPLEKLKEMGRNAAAYRQEHFNREKNIDRIMEVLFRKKENEKDGFVINQDTKIIKLEDDQGDD